MTKITHRLGGGVIAFVAAAVLVAAMLFFRAWLIQICWNYVMPYIFGLPVLTYWQAFAVGVLSSLIIGRTSQSYKEKKS